MKVASVFRRPLRSLPTEECEEIVLLAGLGIERDCHANPLSPRQVLLVSTGAYRACEVPAKSLRENILIQADKLTLFSGSRIRVGRDAVLRVSFQCEPCGRLNRVRPKLSRDIGDMRGHLARVVESGSIRPGDRVRVETGVYRSFPNYWRDRVIEIVHLIPANHVVSYGRLAELAGVPKAFCRVFPRLLRSQPNLPWQRVVPAHQLSTGGNAPQPLTWVGDAIFE
jgi:hypothetical protein